MEFDDLDLMDLGEYLSWIKKNTENEWRNYQTWTTKHLQRYGFRNVSGIGWPDWQRGTKWVGGFSHREIDRAEKTWGLQFPPDYRQFLSTLGVPDRPLLSLKRKGEKVAPQIASSFYDWRCDQEPIDSALKWPLEGLLFDVEMNGLWLPGWGEKPGTKEHIKQKLAELVHRAPPLIPIIGHRYLIGNPVYREGNPVLSVYQSDIIIYATDFKRFLLVELSTALDINLRSAQKHAVANYDEEEVQKIPFWGPLICGEQ
jgi:hypothetical protein